MSKYRVQFGGRCWKTIEVEAESLEDAENIAWDQQAFTPWDEENIDDVECYGATEVEDVTRPCQACRATGMRVDDLIG